MIVDIDGTMLPDNESVYSEEVKKNSKEITSIIVCIFPPIHAIQEES